MIVTSPISICELTSTLLVSDPPPPESKPPAAANSVASKWESVTDRTNRSSTFRLLPSPMVIVASVSIFRVGIATAPLTPPTAPATVWACPISSASARNAIRPADNSTSDPIRRRDFDSLLTVDVVTPAATKPLPTLSDRASCCALEPANRLKLPATSIRVPLAMCASAKRPDVIDVMVASTPMRNPPAEPWAVASLASVPPAAEPPEIAHAKNESATNWLFGLSINSDT